MRKLTAIVTVVLFLFYGCKSKKEVAATVVYQQPDTVVVVDVPVISDSTISVDIQQMVGREDSNLTYLASQYHFEEDMLLEMYASEQYYPLWRNPINRRKGIEVLANSRLHGLQSSDYHMEELLKFYSSYENLNNYELAKYDVLMTDAILLYSYHLIKGKVNPKYLSDSWNFVSRDYPEGATDIIKAALNDELLGETLVTFEPEGEEYSLLQEELERQHGYFLDGGWPKVQLSSTLHSMESDSNMPVLRERLIKEGFLQPSDTSSSLMYDPVLESAVRDFQYKHGLNSDGVLGKSTLQMINLTAEQKMEMLMVNLERMRWVQTISYDTYIKVNIAAYGLNFIEDGELIYDTKVMVGQKQKQTPIFRDRLELIVFNPTWNLPQSIASKETLPKLKRDSNYLEKHNMVLVNQWGEVVPHEGINWNQYSENYFPHMIRQEPGPDNALGRVKFLFPNKYAIYLHDTPSRYLFARDQRAFSHGCIRLQNPLDFALYLLQRENEDWTMDSIEIIVDSAKTQNIRLRRSIPIYLVYHTVSVNPYKEVFYHYDVYERDAIIYRRLMGVTESLVKKE